MPIIPLRVTEPGPAEIAFVLQEPIPAGQLMRIKASGVMMLFSMHAAEVLDAQGQPQEILHHFSRKEMSDNDWMWHINTTSIAMFRTSRAFALGEQIKVRIRYTTVENEPVSGPISEFTSLSGLSWHMFLGTVTELRAEEFKAVAEPLTFEFSPGPIDHLEAYLKPDGRLMIEQYDACGNPTNAEAGNLTIHADSKPIQVACEQGIAATVVRMEGESAHFSRIEIVDSAGRKTLSNAAPFSMDGTGIYFGEFHWHCDFSGDGQRTLDDAMRSARDELGLDFAGPADHIYLSGNYANDRYPAEQGRICRAAEVPGQFCTIAGAEVSGRYGHANLYAEDFELFAESMARIPAEVAPHWEPYRFAHGPLRKLCPPGRAMLVPHHTNMDSYIREKVTAGDGLPAWSAMAWPMPADRTATRLIEMCQVRGCFESEAIAEEWGVSLPGLGGSVQTALTRGYRLGFVGGTDNHCGWPTRGASHYVGVTGVQSEKLDSKSIFHALFNRRCYATSGARIVADATLNGRPMGSELRLYPGEERVFKIRIRGTAPIEAVQIIHFGYALADFPVASGSLDFDVEWREIPP